MESYECDGCGACCRKLIVEVYELDLWREPKLTAHVQPFREPGSGGEYGILSVGTPGNPCPLLDGDNRCAIYATRPTECVAFPAGEWQCQMARDAAGLPPLAPTPVPSP